MRTRQAPGGAADTIAGLREPANCGSNSHLKFFNYYMVHAKKLLQNGDSLICCMSPGCVVKWDSGIITFKNMSNCYNQSNPGC